jgi:hypothetical protein
MTIGKDKIRHFLYGGLFSLLVAAIASSDGHEFNNAYIGCWIGFGSGTLLGMLKEIVWDDLFKKGTPELMDAVFTSAGSAFFSFLLYVIIK